MSTTRRPHAGSKAFYPRKKAHKETPSFSSAPQIEGECRPLNFLGYKAGMTHVLGRDAHSKGVTFGQEVVVPATIIEAPALKIFGIRAYKKTHYGPQPLMDVLSEKVEKEFLRKHHSFKKQAKKKKEAGKEKGKGTEKKPKQEKKRNSLEDLEKLKPKISDLRLLAYSQPKQAGVPKKTPDIFEILLSGDLEKKIAFAKEKLGKDISVQDVFKPLEFVDTKAVTKGKGMQGPVKRFGVKVQRPKAKKRRIVGSIGPWNPSTIMWQVARAGQMGYHNRTEFNKKILKIGASAEEIEDINPDAGFKNYGMLKTDFIVLTGSVPGPAKRAIGLRMAIRKPFMEKHKLEGIDFIATSKKETSIKVEARAEKVKVAEEKKEEKKSVEEEIKAAVTGGDKKPKEQKAEEPKAEKEKSKDGKPEANKEKPAPKPEKEDKK